jgi:hypothetical protein
MPSTADTQASLQKGKAMNSNVMLFVLGLCVAGCTASGPKVTLANGRSPASDHAPPASMNDSDALRRSFNHGNGALWVMLPPDGIIRADVQKDGWLRMKFPWWRGVAGELTVEGRRLDAPAPPMRSDVGTVAQIGETGVNPAILIFPSEGYWEVTGHVRDKSLTFVVRVVKAA